MVGALHCIVAPRGVLVFFNARIAPFRTAVLPGQEAPGYSGQEGRSLRKRNDGCAMHAIGRSYAMHGIGETCANSSAVAGWKHRVPHNDHYRKEQANAVGQLLPMPHCGKPPQTKMEETVVPAWRPGQTAQTRPRAASQ